VKSGFGVRKSLTIYTNQIETFSLEIVVYKQMCLREMETALMHGSSCVFCGCVKSTLRWWYVYDNLRIWSNVVQHVRCMHELVKFLELDLKLIIIW